MTDNRVVKIRKNPNGRYSWADILKPNLTCILAVHRGKNTQNHEIFTLLKTLIPDRQESQYINWIGAIKAFDWNIATEDTIKDELEPLAKELGMIVQVID